MNAPKIYTMIPELAARADIDADIRVKLYDFSINGLDGGCCDQVSHPLGR